MKKKMVMTAIATKCDRCGSEDHPGNFNSGKYTFGYNSDADMITVSFDICDYCLQYILNKVIIL